MEGEQVDASKVTTPKNTATASSSNAAPKPAQLDASKQIAEMQREFQRQMTSLHNLIVSNNNQTKNTITELSQRMQTISNAIPSVSNPPQTLQRSNGRDEQASGESTTNSSFHSQCTQPIAAKKLYPLPKFEGQPENWPMFYEDFVATTAEFGYTDLQNIIRVREALQGPAREMVESLLSSSKNVKAVMDMLKETYGRPEILIKSQIQKVRICANVAEGKLDQLVNFANKVNNMAEFLKSVKGDHHLSNPSLLSELVSKLPTSRQMQWAEKCVNMENTPTVMDFSAWLNCLRKLANMVSDALPSTSTEITNRRQQYQPAGTQKTNKYAMVSVSQKRCLVCQGNCVCVAECEQFCAMTTDDRWKRTKELRLCFSCLKPYHQVSSCYSSNVCGVNNCPRKHNYLLHKADPAPTADVERVNGSSDRVSCHVDGHEEDVLFQIIPVKIYHNGKETEIYAFIDDGANATMLDWEVARRLGIQGKPDTLKLQWLNGRSSSEPTEIVDVVVSAYDNEKEKYEMRKVYLTNKLELPTQTVIKHKLVQKNSGLVNMPIIDYISARPQMIISIAHAFLTIPIEVAENSNSGPFAIKCKLGVIVFGPLKESSPEVKRVCCAKVVKPKDADEEMKAMMKQYFEIESCGVKLNTKPIMSNDHQRALEILQTTTKYIGDRYECGLLWKSEDIEFPPSFQMAYKRFQLLKNKFRKDKTFEAEYSAKMEDLFKKGYARRLHETELQITPKTFFLPHFAVTNPNKSGIRVVFDAAAKVNGISLNDKLLAGPDLNNTLISVLHKFREAPIGVCGDIREMFLQVAIRNDDINAQRFLWKNQIDEDSVQQCVMQRMIFGAACSPTAAQYVKNQNAKMSASENPRAVSAIVDRHYVDDYVDCFQSESEAVSMLSEVQDIHKRAGFDLCKIISNSEYVMEMFQGATVSSVDVSSDRVERVLGMQWNPTDDEFIFILKYNRVPNDIIELRRKPTKRETLSVIMSTFDPFGFLANITVTGKILMQSLWKYEMDWDDELPDELRDRWVEWLCEMRKVRDFRIPRCHFSNFNNVCKELHIFCDASEQATAVVAYWRIKTPDSHKVSFISGKANCAPTKYQSVPRLELQAAVFAVRLRDHILESHSTNVNRIQFWTDSHTVIRWINSDSRKYKQFVANRIGEILESSATSEWRWLPGSMNPADDATRACTKYEHENRWKNGPLFLQQSEEMWPKINEMAGGDDGRELKSKHYVMTTLTKDSPFIDFTRFSNYRKLKRAVAWALRFINNIKTSARDKRSRGTLSVDEEERAEKILCRIVQQSVFYAEYKCLQENLSIDSSSELRSLCPFLDSEGLMRVQGRLDNAAILSYAAKKPCILPKKHNFTNILIHWYHCRCHHGNTHTVINEIRQKFWIPAIRAAVNRVQSGCYECRYRKAKPNQPIMGQLPMDRVTPYLRPFSYTGVDYFGPVEVTIRRQREKRWIALFTCLTTRAVHLEIAMNLSSDACIMCIRNFVNRRGVPIQIRSDNGTNFVGLKKELTGERGFLDHDEIQAGLVPLGIKWKFNTPSNPSAGGAWERLVQSVKRSLSIVLKEQAPRLETLYALLVETENIVNSRPLTHIPVTPDAPEPLTPNHFLLGCTNSTQTPAAYENRISCSRKQWRILQNLKNGIWKRWIKEYLPELTRRSKWFRPAKPISVGCLVLICDDNEPRSKWKRSRILNLVIGKDGVARSANVRTPNGTLSRPVNKLAILDVEDGGESPQMESTHGGGDVDDDSTDYLGITVAD